MALHLTLACWAVLELGLRVRERLQGKGSAARDRATRALIAVTLGAAIALAVATASRATAPRIGGPYRAAGLIVIGMAEGVALVRRPSRRMADGITTHMDRMPADAGLAARQYEGYVDAVAGAGWTIREVPTADELPDSAFVEDTVVVCGDLAVLARPGAVERRAEVAGTEEAVRSLGLEVARIEAPGTLDGGDVLQVGSIVYVGRGDRTNAEGIRQLRRHAATRGRTVVAVRLHGVLHLKSAVTALPDGTFIASDASLFDAAPFPTMRAVPEEGGSHVILMGGATIIMAASAPRSAELFDDLGFDVITVDIGEFEKREGCVTCLSVLIADRGA